MILVFEEAIPLAVKRNVDGEGQTPGIVSILVLSVVAVMEGHIRLLLCYSQISSQ